MAPNDFDRAQQWRLRTQTLTVGRLPLLMGIVNVTPDSFSDGGHYFDADAAIEHGLRLVAEGADILDVGGESTRPYSEPVSVQEELRRVMPVVGALCKQTRVPVSIDTSKALVARHAVHAGAEIINDVTALTGDPAMLPLAAETGCGVCAMHMLGTPRTMQQSPTYADVVAEVTEYLRQRRDALLAAGIQQDRIALDPGIGFGKTTEHNLELLANAWRFHELGCPVLIGHSRKRFLAALLGQQSEQSTAEANEASRPTRLDCRVPRPTLGRCPACPPVFSALLDKPAVAPNSTSSARSTSGTELSVVQPPPAIDRTAGVIGVALALARQGVQILRVHDVAAVRQALRMFAAAGGLA